MATSFCYPPFHATFAPLAAGPQTTVFSGCSLNAQGNIGCAPEAMRTNAEAQLQRLAPGLFSGRLSLEAYTLARYMASEVGSGTVEERVAVGEAAVNQAKRRPGSSSILNVLLYNQSAGHPNYGFYGPIHGPDGVTTAPYRRWASTRLDPTVLTLLLANLIVTGQSNNFARGADDQSDLFNRKAYPNPVGTLQFMATKGNYWVGPLPGVDHRKTFLFRNFGFSPVSPQGAALLMQGIAAVSSNAAPDWPANLPICTTAPTSTSSTGRSNFATFMIGMGAVGGLVGLGWLSLRVAKSLATSGTMLGDVGVRRRSSRKRLKYTDQNGVMWTIHPDPSGKQWLAEVDDETALYSPSLSATSKADALKRAAEYAAASAEP
jgi:hypothetical protein